MREIEPRPIEVKALENYTLYIKFSNNEEKILNISKLIKENKIYEKLKNKDYFKVVKVSGCTIEWKNGEEIAPQILYNKSININDFHRK